MHIITVSVTVSLIKIQLLMILRKGLLTEVEENKKKKKKNLRKAIFFFGKGLFLVGRSTANQHFFKVGLSYCTHIDERCPQVVIS